jgi:tripartite-type tricarboxylate transporter receptor subunit TctC
MSRTLGQQLVIENVAGAGGTVGSTRAMRATPDGYTIQMGQMGTHAGAVALYPHLAYKPESDFAPIGLVVDQAVVIFARKDFPATTLQEFVTYVKANGERLNVGHAGVGSISHFTCLLLDSTLGVKPTMVPFGGAAPAINALMGGQTDYMCDSISNVVQQIQGGTVKGFAVATEKRNQALPNVPTTKEAGLPEFQATGWYALFAPKATPKPIVATLTAALDKALDDPGVQKRLADLGCDIPEKERRGPAPLAAFVKSEIARWTPVIKAANITME